MSTSFKLKGSIGNFGTEIILKSTDKDGKEKRTTVKVKYKDGVVTSDKKEIINFFNDRDDHMNVTNSDALLAESEKENAKLRKENKDMAERLEEYEKVPETTHGAKPTKKEGIAVGNLVSFESDDKTLEGEVSSVNKKGKAIVVVDGTKHKNIPVSDLTVLEPAE